MAQQEGSAATPAFTVEEHNYTGADGAKLFYRFATPPSPKAGVLLLHGYAEHSGRFIWVMEQLCAAGYAVLAPDHRGHGRSAERLGDLRSVDAVLGDLVLLHRQLVSQLPGKPLFLFGHSFGGQLAVRLLERHQRAFAGAVVNGAALQVPDDIPRVMLLAAKVIAKVSPALPVQPFYHPENICLDPDVWRALDQDPLFYKGKMRAGTGDQLLRSIYKALDALPSITLPVLVTAGQGDKTVPPRASQLLFDGLGSTDKRLHYFPGLSHEPHNDPPKADVLAYWIDWLDAHMPASP